MRADVTEENKHLFAFLEYDILFSKIGKYNEIGGENKL